MAQELAHSSIGASSMDRWSVCPGSVRLSKGLPSTQSEYARQGTIAHDKAAMWLNLEMEPPFPQDKPGREMRLAVKEYVLTCRKYITDIALDMGAVWGVEERVDLSSVYPGCFGTADFWVYWPWLKKLIVIDFKYGAGVFVSVIDNLQAQYYALGVLLKHPEFEVQAIEIGISQPRCMTDGETFRTMEISKLELLFDFKPRLVEAASRTAVVDAPLVPGDHCRWCPAGDNRVCPATKNLVVKQSAQVFDEILGYDPLDLKNALDARPAIRAYLSSLDEFAYKELERGVDIPGYKLVAKRPARFWINEETVANHLRAAGYGDRIYEVQELKSPAQMEDMLGKDAKGLIAGFFDKRSSGHTVVTIDDDRPSVRLGAQQVFDEIDVDPFS